MAFIMEKDRVLEIKTYTDINAEKVVIMSMDQEDVTVHGHDCFELTYVTGGSAKHTLNGETGTLQAGDYFIVDYGSRHSYEESRNFTLINCLFLPELIDSALADCYSFEELLRVCLIRYYKQYYGQSLANHILHDEDGQVLELLLGIRREYEGKKMGYTEVCRCRLMEIMILTMRGIVQENSKRFAAGSEHESTAILELIGYLQIHYRDRAVLKHFCEEYHFSLQYISGRFKRETGVTVMEYLQKIRIEKSCQLLLGSDLTI